MKPEESIQGKGEGGAGELKPVRFDILMDTPRTVRVMIRFPIDIEHWAMGASAVTEGSRLQRYGQMYAERKRVSDLIKAALEPVIADANRTMEKVRAIIAANPPVSGGRGS